MKHVSILIPQGDLNLISIVGAYKAFMGVNQYLVNTGREPMFTVQFVGNMKRASLNDSLISVSPNADTKQVTKTDLIIIPGITANVRAPLAINDDLLPWIVKQHRKGAEVVSLCTGAFLLASTGLLDGKSCSTHWMSANLFSKMFPNVNLVTEKIITDEHGIYTSGGAFSFINVLLYLIEKYCGREVAIYCSKVYEVDIDRNFQSPYMMFSGLKDHQDEEIKKAQLFIEKNVSEKISVETLADKFAIGRRNFDRRFMKATSNSPVEYLQKVKIEAAKKKLETSRETINEVMYGVGYNDHKAFRTVFKRLTGLSPLEYRKKYNKHEVSI